MWHLHFQHHYGDDDSNDTVAERFQSIFSHQPFTLGRLPERETFTAISVTGTECP
jgi:hypothetical protein